MKRTNDHPEVTTIKNICDISPETKTTKGVCDKVNREKNKVANSKKSRIPHVKGN